MKKVNRKITCIFLAFFMGAYPLMAANAQAPVMVPEQQNFKENKFDNGNQNQQNHYNQSTSPRNKTRGPKHNGRPLNHFPETGNYYGQQPNHFPQTGNYYGQQPNHFPQPGNYYGQQPNHFPQPGNYYGQQPNHFPQPGNYYAPPPNFSAPGKLDIAGRLLSIGAGVLGNMGATQGNKILTDVSHMVGAAADTTQLVSDMRRQQSALHSAHYYNHGYNPHYPYSSAQGFPGPQSRPANPPYGFPAPNIGKNNTRNQGLSYNPANPSYGFPAANIEKNNNQEGKKGKKNREPDLNQAPRTLENKGLRNTENRQNKFPQKNNQEQNSPNFIQPQLSDPLKTGDSGGANRQEHFQEIR